jgi:hypothetical protein
MRSRLRDCRWCGARPGETCRLALLKSVLNLPDAEVPECTRGDQIDLYLEEL